MNIELGPITGNDRGAINEGCPSLTPYLLEGDGPYPVVIVYPGGGYGNRAHHEGEPVAQWLNGLGVSAFVLNYRVAPFKYPDPHDDATRAIRTVRARAAEWKLDPDRIGVLGFSAGGHLASSSGTHYDLGNPAAEDPIERASSRPDLMILCYPVITMGDFTHQGSRNNLFGANPSAEQLAAYSNENQVTGDTPPAFLWHTADDGAVHAENSLRFASALIRHGVPCELHLFESGPHGLGLAADHDGARAWPELCAAWLEARKFI